MRRRMKHIALVALFISGTTSVMGVDLTKAYEMPDASELIKSNCVACHNIEGAVGAGNIGPDLSNYKAIFIDTKVRNPQFIYQKIADPRIDNPNTHMTVNLTTGLFNEQEICDYVAYVISDKKKK